MTAKLNIGSIEMGEADCDRFIVMSRMTASSHRQKVSSIVGYFVRRRWQTDYVPMLQYEADKHGITFDEAFQRYLDEQPLSKTKPVAIKNETYDRLTAEAEKAGLSLSEYVEQILDKPDQL